MISNKDKPDLLVWRFQMVFEQLAQSIMEIIAPALPYLIIGGKKAAEEAAKKMGSDAWEKAKALWDRLSPRMKSRAKAAARDVAASPDDPELQKALKKQLEEILSEDPHLAEEVSLLVTARQRVGELHGLAKTVEAEEIMKGAIEAEQDVNKVAPGGEAIAVEVERLAGGEIKADQKLEKIEEGGKAIGIKIKKM